MGQEDCVNANCRTLLAASLHLNLFFPEKSLRILAVGRVKSLHRLRSDKNRWQLLTSVVRMGRIAQVFSEVASAGWW